jgi:hypothetical protein
MTTGLVVEDDLVYRNAILETLAAAGFARGRGWRR